VTSKGGGVIDSTKGGRSIRLNLEYANLPLRGCDKGRIVTLEEHEQSGVSKSRDLEHTEGGNLANSRSRQTPTGSKMKGEGYQKNSEGENVESYSRCRSPESLEMGLQAIRRPLQICSHGCMLQ